MNKYIINDTDGIETAVLLCEHVLHKAAAAPQKRSKSVAAGFWSFNDQGRVKVGGDSVSLNLRSRPEDAGIIEETLLMMGLKTDFNLKARVGQLVRATCKLSPVDAENSIGMSSPAITTRKEHPMVPAPRVKKPSDQTTEKEIPAEALA